MEKDEMASQKHSADKKFAIIKNSKKLINFERKFIKSENLSIEEKYKILNSMYKEARYLGVFPLKNPLEGIEVDIKIAKVVNSV